MKLWKPVLIAALGSALLAGGITYIAARENSQGEYNGPDGHLSAALLAEDVFLLYFIPFGLLSEALAVAIWYSARPRRSGSDGA